MKKAGVAQQGELLPCKQSCGGSRTSSGLRSLRGNSRHEGMPKRTPTCLECHIDEGEIHDCVIRLRSSGAPLRWMLCPTCMQLFDVVEDYGEVH